MAGDKVDDSDDDKKNEEQTSGKVYNVKPPEMIKDGVNFDVYKQRLERWSRLSGLNPQTQFDLVMTYIDPSNELVMKLEREIGNSKVAKTEGVKVLLDKLEEWFGKEDVAPYTKWFKCRHCKCKCTPSFKRCSCPCSNHKSANCPTKGDQEIERKYDDPIISQVSLPLS